MSGDVRRTASGTAGCGTEVPLVEMSGIFKQFGPVRVLEGVDFDIRSGEVHVLAGENGAGKSTLIKILAGVHTATRGEVRVHGQPVVPRSPRESVALGIAVIHQELSLIPSMTVADNLALGRSAKALEFVDGASERRAAREWLARLGVEVDPEQRVEELPIATQQLIEIAKALSFDAQVLVMDEPTSTLNSVEAESLFARIAELRAAGAGIVYISHKMDEIERLADRITVLRDGVSIGTAPAAELPTPKLLEWMVGREAGAVAEPPVRTAGSTRLAVTGFSVHPRGPRQPASVHDVSLSVGRGEVVGLGGLQGAGISELFLGLFGAYGSQPTGRITIDGEGFTPEGPADSIRAGLALLTNDRKATGLVLPRSVTENATLASLSRHCRGPFIQRDREQRAAGEWLEKLRLRAVSLEVPVDTLSGGNQQKVALAKWLATEPRLLLLDEPTRGIDVHAKQEIYRLIHQWTEAGIAILLATSEMPELLHLSDRIYVMHRGRVSGEFTRDEANPERVLAAAMGIVEGVV